MLRVTIELVPYGVEAMAKTIAELCIANVGGDTEPNVANYEAAGYLVTTDNKIEDLAMILNYFPRNDGVLELLKQILSQDIQPIEKVKLAETLIQHTRLANQGGENEHQ